MTHISAAVSILHIPRFYIFYETTQIKLARAAIRRLCGTPKRALETAIVKTEFGKHTVKALLSKEYSKIFGQRVKD